MNFRTKIAIPKSNYPIDYHSKLIFIGSCFAENMGEKFGYFKFQNEVNPFGILFHPLAISKIICRAVNQLKFTKEELFFHNGQWHCYDVHSVMSDATSQGLLEKLNKALIAFKQQLQEASHLFFTYGTAWVYREKRTDAIVANCHKVPNIHFEKEILSVEQIEKAVWEAVTAVQKINPAVALLFTVSPVRHLKDGFVENQRSKAHLTTAVHKILNTNQAPENALGMNMAYFPAYEIMMDELRDYRFYAEDMIHPNATAVNYIWKRLVEATVATESFSVMKEVEDIQKALAHRPFNPDAEEYTGFKVKYNEKIKSLTSRIPHIEFQLL